MRAAAASKRARGERVSRFGWPSRIGSAAPTLGRSRTAAGSAAAGSSRTDERSRAAPAADRAAAGSSRADGRSRTAAGSAAAGSSRADERSRAAPAADRAAAGSSRADERSRTAPAGDRAAAGSSRADERSRTAPAADRAAAGSSRADGRSPTGGGASGRLLPPEGAGAPPRWHRTRPHWRAAKRAPHRASAGHATPAGFVHRGETTAAQTSARGRARGAAGPAAARRAATPLRSDQERPSPPLLPQSRLKPAQAAVHPLAHRLLARPERDRNLRVLSLVHNTRKHCRTLADR